MVVAYVKADGLRLMKPVFRVKEKGRFGVIIAVVGGVDKSDETLKKY